jgi:hypothetical protein
MVRTPNKIDKKINELLERLSITGTPIYVDIRPDDGSNVLDCFENVRRKIIRDHGTMILGWQIWELPFMIEAEFHAIWKSPTGELIDITPKPINENQILFIADPNAKYDERQIDNVRMNTSNNRLVDDYIELYKAKFRIENKGNLAKINGEIFLQGNEARIWETINSFIDNIRIMITKGLTHESMCFCSGNLPYSLCHGRDLIEKLKKI